MRQLWGIIGWLPLVWLPACVASQTGAPRPGGLLPSRPGLKARVGSAHDRRRPPCGANAYARVWV